MARVLGIDTSNYTTSIAVVDNGELILDSRRILKVKRGERGLRQSEALFQHINNLPELLQNEYVQKVDAICVSTKPRPVDGSYMPVFRAGESIAMSIACATGARLIRTTHQEGHIEAALQQSDIGFDMRNFICFHISGGTTEVLSVTKNHGYDIQILGRTRDISAGQLIDRVGVALGNEFPCGKGIDSMAMECIGTDLRIPSKIDVFDMNFSGQETLCLKYIKDGYNQNEIAYALMLCISKTFEKVIENLNKRYNLPILLSGGVASSKFISAYLKERYGRRVSFSRPDLSSDNAVGVAHIGYKCLMEVD